jgi:hypothetical protein
MSIQDNIPALERPVFFDGQRLTAADLQAAQEYQRELRWLHNRSLHTWGIVFGLEVTGARDDREVKVQAGFALDCLGRELILSDPLSLPIPPVAGVNSGPAVYYLTLSFQEDAQLTPSESENGVCGTSGAVRLPETPKIRFQLPSDTDPEVAYRFGKDVILASVPVQNCKLSAPPSPKERRDARPANQPYVATGFAAGSAASWGVLKVGGQTVGLEVKVDTSTAGFGSTPVYLGQVVGTRSLQNAAGLIDGMINIADASPTGFTLQMLLPQNLQVGNLALNPAAVLVDPAAVAGQLNWSVAWMGIEG